MRSGELTVPTGTPFDPAMHSTPMDVEVDSLVNPTMLGVRLKSSKTDQAWKGVYLYVGRTYNSLCPVVAMLRYLAARGFDQGPLFRLENGSPLTRAGLVERVRSALTKAGIKASHYCGHSFRIGAATAYQPTELVMQPSKSWADGRATGYSATPARA